MESRKCRCGVRVGLGAKWCWQCLAKRLAKLKPEPPPDYGGLEIAVEGGRVMKVTPYAVEEPEPPKLALPSVDALAWALFCTDSEVLDHVAKVADYRVEEDGRDWYDDERYYRARRIAWERGEPRRARTRCEVRARSLLARLEDGEEPPR